MTAERDETEGLIAVIRQKGRWPSVAKPLLAALERETWRENGFPSPTAWLDRLAALGGRSTTYLSRCVSAARFLTRLAENHSSVDVSGVWNRSLSDIEEFRRRMGDDQALILQHLSELSSGALTSYGLRLESKQLGKPAAKAERMSLEEIVLEQIDQLLSKMGYPPDTKIIKEPRTPIGRPDLVFVEPETGATTIIEVKSSLSRRRQDDIIQQLLAYSSVGQKVWLLLPADSELPGHLIIQSLRQTAIKHVGLLLIDPSTGECTEVFPPEVEAVADEPRTIFKNLVLASKGIEGALHA